VASDGVSGEFEGADTGAMLTHLDGPSARDRLQGTQGFGFVGVAGACALAVERSAGFGPGRVVDDGKATAPEESSAMRHGHDA
jgi:hypothetical protein